MTGLKKYETEVFTLLHCSEKEKRWHISRIEDALGENADALSFDEITAKLGKPETWVMSHVENAETEQFVLERKKLQKRARHRLIIFAVVAVCVLLLLVGFILWDTKTRGTGGEYSTLYNMTRIE